MDCATDKSAVNTDNVLPLHRAILFILNLKNWFLPLRKRGNSSTKIIRYRTFRGEEIVVFYQNQKKQANKPWRIYFHIHLNITSSSHSSSYQFCKRFPYQKDEYLSCFPIFAAFSSYLRTLCFTVSLQYTMLLSMWQPQIITYFTLLR